MSNTPVVPEMDAYVVRLSEMLQAEQTLRHQAEAEIAALKQKLKKRATRRTKARI
jgi:hypothetical protein